MLIDEFARRPSGAFVSTVSKAVDLLNWFSVHKAEIGLAELQRLSGYDKATTYRYLSSLEASGLLEQNDVSRAYRMGPAVLRLAHIREVTVPRREGVRLVLPRLADKTGETAHASVLQGTQLVTLEAHASSRHSARVVIGESALPLHATASGIAVLAYAESSFKTAALKNPARYTEFTHTKIEQTQADIQNVMDTGFGLSDQGYECGVFGVAVPLFDSTDTVAGAVAVASVTSRVNAVSTRLIKSELIGAAREITRSWGGVVPKTLNELWSDTLTTLADSS